MQTFSASGTFTVPAGVTSVNAQCWGGGGKGGTRTSTGIAGGGGGGAYSLKAVTVIPGTTYNVSVGMGSSTTSAAGDSWFINNTTVLAKGGNSVANNTATGATGGASASGIGDTKYSGGNGADGGNFFVDYGGGGGSSAGTAANGANGFGFLGGGAPTGGGNGGFGGINSQGTGGSIPGGGGGGASSDAGSQTGSNGANGRVVLSWTCPTYSINAVVVTVPAVLGNSASIQITSGSLADATYIVTYDLSGDNTASGQTASLIFSGGSGTFQTIAITNSGTTTVTITDLTNGTAPQSCSSTVSANNASSFSFAATNGSTTYGSNSIFTVPAGVTSITVQAWGGGGAGRGGGGKNGGGGGGAFATRVISVSSGQMYPVTVGAGGPNPGNPGGNSQFGTTAPALVIAVGGASGDGNAGAVGGQAAACTPTTGAQSGGSGGNVASGGSNDAGGGGGGSATSGAVGNPGGNGSGDTGGSGGTGEGTGGMGGSGSNGSGSNGIAPGGGGGGRGGSGGASGAGAAGQVIVTYTCATLTLTSGSGTDNQTINNSALTNITYQVGVGATGATVSGLPAGVSGSFNAGVLTISGAPTATGTFNYMVSATGSGCTDPLLTGTIEVSAVLPIQLLSFTGKQIDKTIELNWQTATEENNDFMAVERSADGIRFVEIGRVQGAGTTTKLQSYSLIDASPLSGANYYRLRQVDFDGRMQYHKVINIDFTTDKPSDDSVQVYPNPAGEKTNVSWVIDNNAITTLKVFNISGQLMGTYVINKGNGSFELPLTQLPAGNYILVWIQGNQQKTLRFIKQ